MPIKHIAKRKGSYVLAVRWIAHNVERPSETAYGNGTRNEWAHSDLCGLVEALYDVHPLDVAEDILSAKEDKRQRRKVGKPGGSPPVKL